MYQPTTAQCTGPAERQLHSPSQFAEKPILVNIDNLLIVCNLYLSFTECAFPNKARIPNYFRFFLDILRTDMVTELSM